jgi:ABC-type glycerol-3-phosphate transport system permease component
VVVVVLAFFILFKNLGLLDTLRGMIIVYTGFSLPLTTCFMESFFKQVPVDLEEAAYIDMAPLVAL